MAKSADDRIAYLESSFKALREELAKHFHMTALPAFEPEGETEADELEGMTVAQLKEHASDNGISLAGLTTKAEILAAIKAAPVA